MLTFDMDGVVEAMKDIEKEQSKSDQDAGEGSSLPGVPSDVADMAEKVNEMTETLTQSLGVATEATSRNSAEIIAKLSVYKKGFIGGAHVGKTKKKSAFAEKKLVEKKHFAGLDAVAKDIGLTAYPTSTQELTKLVIAKMSEAVASNISQEVIAKLEDVAPDLPIDVLSKPLEIFTLAIATAAVERAFAVIFKQFGIDLGMDLGISESVSE